MDLKGSKTEQHLKDAFAGKSQANRRYLYFAQKADVEGHPDVASLFRSTAEGETAAVKQGTAIRAGIDQPSYSEEVEIPAAARETLAGDLQ